jgi:2,3-dihydroxybenzoate-AMP ligase
VLAGAIRSSADLAASYRRKRYWTDEIFGVLPSAWAAQRGQAIAIVAGDGRLTYADLDLSSSRIAAGFRALGVRAGDRVVVQLPNVAAFFEVMFALFKVGAIPVVVLPAYRRSEVSYFCRFTEAVAYVIADRHAGFDFRVLSEEVSALVPTLQHVIVAGDAGPFHPLNALRSTAAEEQPAPRNPSDVALLHLSGGTTGTPKLVPRTHNDYLYGARASAELCGFADDTVYLCSLPVAHQFSLSAPGALGTLLNGGRVVLASGPAPDVAFPLIEREAVTVAAVVPPVAMIWLDAATRTAHDLSSLRLLQVGGAKLTVDAAAKVRPVLNCELQQVFGMTEGLLNFTRLDDPDDVVHATQGRPLSPDDEIRIADDGDADVPAGEPGNLLVRGPNTIRGYYRADEHNKTAFTADGYFRTGDIVRQTPTGHLVVVGRAKDQINRGAEKIAAEEIETHLLAHRDVAEAAVIGIPDEFLGERVCAYVVPSGAGVSAAELRAFLRERGLAASKVPDRVETLDALPRTAVGKINKQKLRDIITAAGRA